MELTYSGLPETPTRSVIRMICSAIGGDGYTMELSLYRDGVVRARGRGTIHTLIVLTSCDDGVPYDCKATIGGTEVSSNILTFEFKGE